jgi:GntR family transcriptional regulator
MYSGGEGLHILISSRSDEPIYEQIKTQIKDQILEEKLSEGTMLPSIRKLAMELGISVITTSRAYQDLEKEGFIATIRGKGSYILSRDNEMVKEEFLKRIENALSEAIEQAKFAKISREELESIFEALWECD